MPGKITSLLNLANVATEMDIMYRLELALSGDGNMVTYCLKLAIAAKKPTSIIIQTCKDMIADNPLAMENIIGKTLVNKIANYSTLHI